MKRVIKRPGADEGLDCADEGVQHMDMPIHDEAPEQAAITLEGLYQKLRGSVAV